ncbi:hypothetical protein [Burkholderia ubonensis]|uniref:Uncharacterized protein n=1 Tax=Burkholderia ubonensis subsp. mesacidophila TaxID=265293 RepID=A0A2A4FBZ8_9BURK|nr:hypothetical protein [Burkholderia ubonensis]PCE30114.1 hypothetical protein BZL54_23400 [Burkholderia ubonensis subsp. mesacidophila]
MKIDSSLVAGPAQAAANLATAGASGNQQATATTAASSTAAGSTASSGTSASAKANAANPASADGATPLGGANSKAEDPVVRQLKELIEKLQKQLAQLEAQISKAAERAKKDPAAMVEQQSLSAQAGEISAALQSAVAKLVEALRKSSSNPAGNMVSEQA